MFFSLLLCQDALKPFARKVFENQEPSSHCGSGGVDCNASCDFSQGAGKENLSDFPIKVSSSVTWLSSYLGCKLLGGISCL